MSSLTIVALETYDIRFPTSLEGIGSDPVVKVYFISLHNVFTLRYYARLHV